MENDFIIITHSWYFLFWFFGGKQSKVSNVFDKRNAMSYNVTYVHNPVNISLSEMRWNMPTLRCIRHDKTRHAIAYCRFDFLFIFVVHCLLYFQSTPFTKITPPSRNVTWRECVAITHRPANNRAHANLKNGGVTIYVWMYFKRHNEDQSKIIGGGEWVFSFLFFHVLSASRVSIETVWCINTSLKTFMSDPKHVFRRCSS